jgi:hypothetical protein
MEIGLSSGNQFVIQMKTPFVKFTLPALICFAAVQHTARSQDADSQTMISNLNQLWTQPGMGDFETVVPGLGYGFMFETGATPYTLDAITFEMLNGGSPATLQVQLYALQGSLVHVNPDLVLAGQLGNPVVDSRSTQWPGYTSFIDFTPDSPTTLAPDTYYLIGATEPVNGNDDNALTFNGNFSYTVSGDWSLPRTSFPYWQYLGPPAQPPSPPNGWETDASASLMLEVDATPVPEPSALGLLAVGAVALLVRRRRNLAT